ncbi:hypothetical protein PM082_011061 [Marasmius tenuissimus]|nr:hypothetical protein PM082_011061 [Marasmius tenuissimus]
MKIVTEELEGRQDVKMAHDRVDDVYNFLRSLLTNRMLFYFPTAAGTDNVHRHFMKRRRGSQLPCLSSTPRLSTKDIIPTSSRRRLDQLSSDSPLTVSVLIYFHCSKSSPPLVILVLYTEDLIPPSLPPARPSARKRYTTQIFPSRCPELTKPAAALASGVPSSH